jgi:hypothetical protein
MILNKMMMMMMIKKLILINCKNTLILIIFHKTL